MLFGCLFFWLRSTRMTRQQPQEETDGQTVNPDTTFPAVTVSSRVTRLT